MARIAPPPVVSIKFKNTYVTSVDGTHVHLDPVQGHRSIFVTPGVHRVMIMSPGARRTAKELTHEFLAGYVYTARADDTPGSPTHFYLESKHDTTKR